MTLLESLADIRKRLVLKKDSTNPHFKNEYLSLNGLLAALQPLLEEHNLLLTQPGNVTAGGFVVSTIIQCVDGPPVDEDGNITDVYMISSDWPIPVTGGQKQAGDSTYARRYGLLALLGLCADDDDGETASQTVGAGAASVLARIK